MGQIVKRYFETKGRNVAFPLVLLFVSMQVVKAQDTDRVGLYRTFEHAIENNKHYQNKFTDVELSCAYTSPSEKTTVFSGFFDGDGKGGGNSTDGNVWKIRFLPDEAGTWTYRWQWSDGTSGGEGEFFCDPAEAGKGILKAFQGNPHWLAYNGTEPVWLKSYYESGHGSIAQPFEWITENVYQPIIDRGYNHLQVNWLLSLCCFEQVYNDGPAPGVQDLLLYQEGKVSTTMSLDVWKRMEQHAFWLNERNIGLQMFLGFDGSKNHSSGWDQLSETDKDFFVRYVVSRLAPLANIAGWNFVWEVPGDRLSHELGWARLIRKCDVFGHLCSYQDEFPKTNEFYRDEYNFAGVENHGIVSDKRDQDRLHWREAWTHHQACLAGYVPGKPVYMVEGNALWRRYWGKRTGATPDDLRQAVWACATAGASFNWCGHLGEDSLMAFGPEGLPFNYPAHEYAPSAFQLDLLADVMNRELKFYTMNPSDSLLSEHDDHSVWCLSEPAKQYLVFSAGGKPFKLRLKRGNYTSNLWLNAITGESLALPPMTVTGDEPALFTPPHLRTDWVLIVRNEK